MYERLAVAEYALHLHCHINYLCTGDNLLTSEVGVNKYLLSGLEDYSDGASLPQTQTL